MVLTKATNKGGAEETQRKDSQTPACEGASSKTVLRPLEAGEVGEAAARIHGKCETTDLHTEPCNRNWEQEHTKAAVDRFLRMDEI